MVIEGHNSFGKGLQGVKFLFHWDW